MGERRGRAGFLLEAAKPLGVGRELRGQHFDRDLATELEIPGTVDLSHTPLAE